MGTESVIWAAQLLVRNTAPVARKQRMGTTGPAPVGTCLMTSGLPIPTALPSRRRPLEAAGGGTEEEFWRDQCVLVFKRLSTGTGPVAISAYCKTLYEFPKTKSGDVRLITLFARSATVDSLSLQ